LFDTVADRREAESYVTKAGVNSEEAQILLYISKCDRGSEPAGLPKGVEEV
jgi:hypothetical protein